MSAEYSGRMMGSDFSYADLSSYNKDTTSELYGLPMYGSGPYNPGVPSMAVQVIPQFAAPGYDTLQHGAKGQYGQYFNVATAYPGAGSGNCTMFATRKCA